MRPRHLLLVLVTALTAACTSLSPAPHPNGPINIVTGKSLDQAALAVAMAFAQKYGGYEGHDIATPEIVFVDRATLIQLNGKPWVAATYMSRSQRILLKENFDTRNPDHMAVLVHELVHHYQNVVDTPIFNRACPNEVERTAYEVQNRYLGTKGMRGYSDRDITRYSTCYQTASVAAPAVANDEHRHTAGEQNNERQAGPVRANAQWLAAIVKQKRQAAAQETSPSP